jgi:RNA polymerase sigma factor (sigma-70 family)
MEDRDLIEQYAEQGSETAFATLVDRYLGLVYSAALRRVGDVQAAEEIAQTVFCLLARKACQLPPNTPLSGWLHRTVCFTTAKYWRAELRRRHREQQVASSMIADHSANDPTWNELALAVDEAVNELAQPDRMAILLRFFQDKAFPEIGRAPRTLSVAQTALIGIARWLTRPKFHNRRATPPI